MLLINYGGAEFFPKDTSRVRVDGVLPLEGKTLHLVERGEANSGLWERAWVTRAAVLCPQTLLSRESIMQIAQSTPKCQLGFMTLTAGPSHACRVTMFFRTGQVACQLDGNELWKA